jgi:hypothetical protein
MSNKKEVFEVYNKRGLYLLATLRKDGTLYFLGINKEAVINHLKVVEGEEAENLKGLSTLVERKRVRKNPIIKAPGYLSTSSCSVLYNTTFTFSHQKVSYYSLNENYI